MSQTQFLSLRGISFACLVACLSCHADPEATFDTDRLESLSPNGLIESVFVVPASVSFCSQACDVQRDDLDGRFFGRRPDPEFHDRRLAPSVRIDDAGRVANEELLQLTNRAGEMLLELGVPPQELKHSHTRHMMKRMKGASMPTALAIVSTYDREIAGAKVLGSSASVLFSLAGEVLRVAISWPTLTVRDGRTLNGHIIDNYLAERTRFHGQPSAEDIADSVDDAPDPGAAAAVVTDWRRIVVIPEGPFARFEAGDMGIIAEEILVASIDAEGEEKPSARYFADGSEKTYQDAATILEPQ